MRGHIIRTKFSWSWVSTFAARFFEYFSVSFARKNISIFFSPHTHFRSTYAQLSKQNSHTLTHFFEGLRTFRGRTQFCDEIIKQNTRDTQFLEILLINYVHHVDNMFQHKFYVANFKWRDRALLNTFANSFLPLTQTKNRQIFSLIVLKVSLTKFMIVLWMFLMTISIFVSFQAIFD